jgi:hypothetical protein
LSFGREKSSLVDFFEKEGDVKGGRRGGRGREGS